MGAHRLFIKHFSLSVCSQQHSINRTQASQLIAATTRSVFDLVITVTLAYISELMPRHKKKKNKKKTPSEKGATFTQRDVLSPRAILKVEERDFGARSPVDVGSGC